MKKFFAFLCVFVITLTCLPLRMSAAAAPDIDCKGAILFAESDDGIYSSVLYEYNADEKLYPASTTKIMTAIVALENGDLDEMCTAYSAALAPLSSGKYEGGKVLYLMPGEQMTLLDLLGFALIPSYNEAADVIAFNIGGSIENFVDMMNEKALELGCTGTHFTNSHGLHDENHYTTARDLLTIAHYAMQNETFASIVSQTKYVLPVTNKHSSTTTLYTTNHLLSRNAQSGYVYNGAIGIKTGTTTPAGNCLVAACRENGMTYYCVVMGCPKQADGRIGSFVSAKTLFDYAKKNYSIQTMLKQTEPITEIEVTLSSDGNSVILMPEHPITALLPNDFKIEDAVIEYNVPDSVEAPLEKGQKIGTMTISYNGTIYAEMPLVSSANLSKSQTKQTVNTLRNFLSSQTFKIIIIVIVLLIIIFLTIFIITSRNNRKRRKYGKGRYTR